MFAWSRMFRHEARKEDLNAELESHLNMAINDRIEQGEEPQQARVAALREFGNLPLIEDVTRETWGSMRFESLLLDLKFALRQIRRSPGFAATVIGTLAIGIAAATAMFTVVDKVLLRPLPFLAPSRLVVLQEIGGKRTTNAGAPWLDIEQWIKQSISLQQFGFYGSMGGRNFLQGNTTSLQIDAVTISPNLISVLGVDPSVGHTFVPENVSFTAGENAATVVLSDAVWKEAFGSDPTIVGKVVKINSDSYSVIGVMPPYFEIPQRGASPQVWVPLVLGDKDKTRTLVTPNYTVVGRLKDGASINAVSAEMNTIQARISSDYTDAQLRQDHSGVFIGSYADSLVAGDVKRALLALLMASGVLWLIASVNATNLLLARNIARQREIAMRGALGASRSRILQQFLVEGLVFSCGSTLLGAALAFTAVRLAGSIIPSSLKVASSTGFNFTILAVLCGLTVLTAALCSAWPAFLSAHSAIEPALRQSAPQAGSSRGQNRARRLLVIAEVGMSLALLIACGLLLRTIYALRHVPLGYRTDSIIISHLSIPSYKYSSEDMVVNLYEPMLRRVKQLRGVQDAGYISDVPLDHGVNIQLTLLMNGKNISAMLKPVSPSIQHIFGFRMLAGRFFNDQDTATSQPVVVVNRAFAELYSPDRHNPSAVIGQRFMNVRKNTPTYIIGVLDDDRQVSLAEQSQPEVEVCLPQLTPDSAFYKPSTVGMDLVVLTDEAPGTMIPDLRSILRQLSPEMANGTFSTMDQVVEDSFGNQRLAARLLEGFGASALLLSIAGLYGLLSWAVTQRTREMGVRIALGSSRSGLLWLVFRHAGTMLLPGLVLGTGLSLVAGRLLRAYLFGVSMHDGWTIAAAIVLLSFSGALAAYLPARRAAQVNPIEALRAE